MITGIKKREMPFQKRIFQRIKDYLSFSMTRVLLSRSSRERAFHFFRCLLIFNRHLRVSSRVCLDIKTKPKSQGKGNLSKNRIHFLNISESSRFFDLLLTKIFSVFLTINHPRPIDLGIAKNSIPTLTNNVALLDRKRQEGIDVDAIRYSDDFLFLFSKKRRSLSGGEDINKDSKNIFCDGKEERILDQSAITKRVDFQHHNEEKDDVIQQVEVSDWEKDKYDEDNILCTDHLEPYLTYLEHQIYQYQLGRPYEPSAEESSRIKHKRMESRPLASSKQGKKLSGLEKAIDVAFNIYRHIPLTIYSKQIFLNLGLLFGFFAVIPAFGQEAGEVKALQIGDTISEALWNMPLQVLNHPESSETIRLSDYRDRKIIILDFWSSWCSSCINSFPSLDSLQNIFKEYLQILLVNPASSKDDANRILYIMEKRGKIENNEGKFSVPSIYNDEILTQYFRPKVYPRLIWLNQKGEILAITGKKELSSKRLAELMEGGSRYAN